MVKLLLDEHISPEVAKGIRARRDGVSVYALAEWDGGSLFSKPDEVCLEAAMAHGLIFVTYDLRTIRPLLEKWHAQERMYAGVIFVDNRTVSSADFGGLIRSLIAVVDERGEEDRVNRMAFLGS